jgi:hypothetical protein
MVEELSGTMVQIIQAARGNRIPARFDKRILLPSE